MVKDLGIDAVMDYCRILMKNLFQLIGSAAGNRIDKRWQLKLFVDIVFFPR
ncbi:hypothetical protein SDC9_176553 [bioreactor metagenome]|uniref:Uncharacterized protein n=1 Tax=bioreactor metagenome TaxID=1076179 RepID=A0A645GT25_9ZZZZ